jgi:hypothetical protein
MLVPSLASACDFCGCFNPGLEAPSTWKDLSLLPWANNGPYAAVAEQFTHFGTLQFDGHEVSNPTGQYLDSSVTQLVAGYTFTDRVALQLDAPLIYRSFRRPEGFRIDEGTESGLGDISLLLRVVAYQYASPGRREFDVDKENPVMVEHRPDFSVSLRLLAGLKLPTGGTSRLTEEFHEVELPGAPVSGIHGHDLTLGTGSYDGIFGGQVSLRFHDAFFQSAAQFTLRGDGAHQYHFANDFSAEGGPGYYLFDNKDTAVALQALVTGEYKAQDRFRGSVAEDTGLSSVAIGPRLIASYGRWSAEAAVEIPVWTDNTALQAVADYRIRGAISYHF